MILTEERRADVERYIRGRFRAVPCGKDLDIETLVAIGMLAAVKELSQNPDMFWSLVLHEVYRKVRYHLRRELRAEVNFADLGTTVESTSPPRESHGCFWADVQSALLEPERSVIRRMFLENETLESVARDLFDGDTERAENSRRNALIRLRKTLKREDFPKC